MFMKPKLRHLNNWCFCLILNYLFKFNLYLISVIIIFNWYYFAKFHFIQKFNLFMLIGYLLLIINFKCFLHYYNFHLFLFVDLDQ